ncbi:MAG: TolC family protein [Bacteriovorax sp.]
MKSVWILAFFTVLLAGRAFADLTLKESYESALRTNQGEKINQTLINQGLEIKKENQGNYYPKIKGVGTYLKQENMTPDQKAIGLNLSHSLYKGGRDKLSVESADKGIAIAENQRVLDQLNLYASVIGAYYNYFLNLNDYKNLELLKKQSKERVDETRKRVQVGRSRKGELLQAEAQLASADAQLFNGLGLLIESEDSFYILTGLNKGNNTFTERISVPSDTQGIQAYLDAAYNRVDVKNRELRIDLADLDLKSAKSLYYPTLDLASNYYLNNRIGAYSKTNWDVGLTLSLPLFEGGITQARVRESSERKLQAIYTLEDYKKSIQLEVTSRYETYHRYLDQVKAFDLALDKAKKSYDEAVKDYRLGLVSNLDVLSSLNLYLDSKRNSEKTKIQAMMNLKLLEAATGVLP